MATLNCTTCGQDVQATHERDHIRTRLKITEERLESALAILNGMQLQGIAAALGIRLGDAIGPAILPGIQALKAENAALKAERLARMEPYERTQETLSGPGWVEPN